MRPFPTPLRRTWIPLLVTGLGPSAAAAAYFIFLPGTALPQAVYFGSKVLLFLFPAAWTRWVLREPLSFPGPRRAGMAEGALFGLLVALGMLAAWRFALAGLLDTSALRAQGGRLGFADPLLYLLLAAFLTLVNSACEEYYWRWFVFGRCRALLPAVPAAVLSGLLFASHHAIVLSTYFPLPLALLLSLGIAAGGWYWSSLYGRSRNLWAPWLSHLIVDAGLFVVGYDMLFARR